MISSIKGGRLLGYARVSTDDQDLSLQIDALESHGIAKSLIFMDKLSGGGQKWACGARYIESISGPSLVSVPLSAAASIQGLRLMGIRTPTGQVRRRLLLSKQPRDRPLLLQDPFVRIVRPLALRGSPFSLDEGGVPEFAPFLFTEPPFDRIADRRVTEALFGVQVDDLGHDRPFLPSRAPIAGGSPFQPA